MKRFNTLFSFLICAFLAIAFGAQAQQPQYSSSITQNLKTPVRIAFDNSDQVYVTDTKQKQITLFDATGSFKGTISSSVSPLSIAINSDNKIVIGDEESGHIFKINSDGSTTEIYSGTLFPSDMAFCPDGYLYIVDSKLKQVIVIDISGNLIKTIGSENLLHPAGIAYNPKNNRLLITEHGGVENDFGVVVDKVWMYSLQGNLIGSFGYSGSGNGGFYRIQGLAVDRCGNIYVPDPFQAKVSVFDENGVYLNNFGIWGSNLGELNVPLDIAINSHDSIWMTSMNNNALEIYKIGFSLPTSNITSKGVKICKGDSALIPIQLTGKAPWSFTYTINGGQAQSINNILQTPYDLIAKKSGIYQVTTLTDSSNTGTCFTGTPQIIVDSIVPTSSILGGDRIVCSNDSVLLPIQLSGTAPWSFVYTVDGLNPKEIKQVMSSPFALYAKASGIYEIQSLSGVGCSGAVMNGNAKVSVIPAASQVISATICKGSAYILGGKSYTASGIYTKKFAAANGCDSTVTLNLIVNPEISINTSATICSPQTLQFGSQTLSSAGTYIERFSTLNGCDSVVTLTLSVFIPQQTEESATICEGNSFSFGSQTLVNAGTYSEKFTSSLGCDSTVLLTLEVNSNPTAHILSGDQIICPGASGFIAVEFTGSAPWNFTYTLDGQNPSSILFTSDNPYLLLVTQAGSYNLTAVSGAGCNGTTSSNAALVSVNSNLSSTASASICSNNSYSFGSQTLSSPGVYSETFTSVQGCDSVVTLTLAVNQTSLGTLSASICNGNTFSFGTQLLSSAGVYTEKFTSSNGCDSLVTLNLSVLPDTSSSISASICSNNSYNFGTQTLSSTGTYIEPFIAANGCDSVVTLNLAVFALPSPQFTYTTSGLQVSFSNLTQNASNYQWNFGDGNTSISSNPIYTYGSLGIYIVDLIATNSACGSITITDTLDLLTIYSGGVGADKGITIYPNPSNGEINVEFGNLFNSSISIEIFSASGQLIYANVLDSKIRKQQIDLGAFANGIYSIKITAKDFVKVNKLIISR